jgi:hypothetical protein
MNRIGGQYVKWNKQKGKYSYSRLYAEAKKVKLNVEYWLVEAWKSPEKGVERGSITGNKHG